MLSESRVPTDPATPPQAPVPALSGGDAAATAPEVGGREGPEPTRYGDWEKNGRCIDF
ncbi:MAG TPA: DUF1674 domain-containing protein [Xanthomonadaceae bacterium]|nr:DUF1674 domain-containing protein [Xanthomonadaceae bacterium]